MSRNLSLPAFLEQHGTEEQCRAALYRYRLPRGFVCPNCGNDTGCRLSRGLYQCHRCHNQTSLTAGTIFHGTDLPLTTRFLASYLLTQGTNGFFDVSCGFGLIEQAAHEAANQVDHRDEVPVPEDG